MLGTLRYELGRGGGGSVAMLLMFALGEDERGNRIVDRVSSFYFGGARIPPRFCLMEEGCGSFFSCVGRGSRGVAVRGRLFSVGGVCCVRG